MPKKVFTAGSVLRAADVNEYLTDSRNSIINGGMDVWQRATSSTANNAYGSADRWYQATSAGTTTFSRESTIVPVGSLYSMKIAQASATAAVSISQGIETLNAIEFAGTNVVLSTYVAASASTAMTLDLFFSTSVDNAVSGSWTQITATSGGTVTPTSTTFVRGTAVFAVPSTAKTLLVRIRAASVASGVSLYVGQVKIEEGTVATPFRRAGANFQDELGLCQRYYQVGGELWWTGYTNNGSGYHVSQSLVPTMRVAATVTTTIINRENFPSSNPSVNGSTPTAFNIFLIANATGVRGYFNCNWTAAAEL